LAEETEELVSGVKGKLGELKGLGALLRFGYSVYTPVVDTGIDCLVDVGKGKYREVQVKYREDHGLFQVKEFEPRDSFYIMCYLSTRYGETYWIIPSKTFAQLATRSKGHMRVQIGKEGSPNYERLRNYRENLSQLLTGSTKETQETVSTLRERIKEPHLKEQDYEKVILRYLYFADAEGKLLARSDMTDWVRTSFKRDFSSADWTKLKSGGTRWEKMAHWAISNLKRQGLIEAVEKNQYRITDKGSKANLQHYPQDATDELVVEMRKRRTSAVRHS